MLCFNVSELTLTLFNPFDWLRASDIKPLQDLKRDKNCMSLVEKNPEAHGMDYVHAYIVFEKKEE